MSLESERRLEEWFRWYYEHAPYMETADDPRKIAQFYRRACNGLFECVACCMQDVKRLEHRERVAKAHALNGFWLPPSARRRS